MSLSPSLRKRPHCHTCGTPMAGHKRENNLPICPVKHESGLNSPPPSPPRGRSPARVSNNAAFGIPASGPFRRRNPNWTEPAPRPLHHDPSSACSLVPTVLVDDDGRTINDALSTENRRGPMYTMPAMHPAMQPVVYSPRPQQIQPSTLKRVTLKRDGNSLWIAQNRTFVRQIVESCQKPSVGVAVEGSRVVTILQLILAGIAGGCVVLLGMLVCA